MPLLANESTVRFSSPDSNSIVDLANTVFSLLSEEQRKHINKPALLTNIRYILNYIFQENKQSYVLDAKPGHGKTTALYLVAKYINFMEKSTGIIIILKEKSQQDELKEFIDYGKYSFIQHYGESNYTNRDILYINSDNISYAQKYIEDAKVVVVTHARLEQLLLNRPSYLKGEGVGNYFDGENLLNWHGKRRKIIIDEAPEFFQSNIFGLDSMDWVDPAFNILQTNKKLNEKLMEKSLSFTDFKLFVRSTIQYSVGMELIFNKNTYTSKLSNHVRDNIHLEILDLFFCYTRVVLKNMKADQDFVNKFKWLDGLYHENYVGYINPEQHFNHKNILCNQIIEYQSLGPVLILDGSASYTKTKYEKLGYSLIHTPDYTKYDRLKIIVRNIKTTSGTRKNPKRTTQKLIAQDIKNILFELDGLSVFPLMTKKEIAIYQALEVITEDQLQYFQLDFESNSLPMNLLNTRGKNHLAEETVLYLTSLPIKPPDYYKQLALSLNNRVAELSLILNKSEEDGLNWFKDPFIQKIYSEEILSELVQIIHRTNVRRLNEDSDKPVYIYIASHLCDFLAELFEPYENIILISDDALRDKLSLELQAKKNAQKILEHVNFDFTRFPIYPGKINTIVKDFLNDFYSFENYIHQDESIKIIDSIFAEFNLKVIFMDNSKHYKKIDILESNFRLEN